MDKKQSAARRKSSSTAKKRATMTLNRSSSRLTRDDMAALKELDHLVELQRRREQLAASVPPGISTEQERLDNGSVLYHFTHEELGPLGFLCVAPVPYMMSTHISAEMIPSDPETDAQWDRKYTLFREMVTLCTAALPASSHTAAPSLEDAHARAQSRLYLRFLACDHSIAMFGLAKELSRDDYAQLRVAIDNALQTASPSDRLGIEQRRKELDFYWRDLQERPGV
jgi:hypothetical protein